MYPGRSVTSPAKRAYCTTHKEEKRAYDSAYHAAHREERAAAYAAWAAAHREERHIYHAAYRSANRERFANEFAEFTEWLQVLRTNNGCEDCGTHEGLLDHHHVDPATKSHNISDMYNYSLDALEDELEKCVILCRSCHKKRHAIPNNYICKEQVK